jgi:hypothetical protein
MADLQLAPASDRNYTQTAIIVVVALAIIGGAIYFLLPHQDAKLATTDVQIFAPRTEFKAARNPGGMNIIGAQDSATEDDLYVIATVRVEDDLGHPLAYDSASGTVTLKDDATVEGTPVARSDLQRLQGIFPNLTPLTQKPIGFGDETAPKKPLEGQVVLQFPGVSGDMWKSKKSAELTVGLRNETPLIVKLP